ncbi:MAG: threonylcarbamoyl-AMP synthase [Anaerolineales bacterium]|nr:threonylcarbamoyl-AMP synthase [Anaerolineales bacterium]
MLHTTRVLQVDAAEPAAGDIEVAAVILRAGGLVAFPTETVYGLGANALDSRAVARIFEAKGRPFTDPLIVHIAADRQLEEVAEAVPPLAHRLAARFWPGPLTLVLKRRARVPATVSGGRDTVAVRMPNHPVALRLIAAAGLPVAAPSANLFMRPSPTQASHVLDDLSGRVDLILDAGPCPIGVESTVLDLTTPIPVVLRPGGAPVEDLRALVPDLEILNRQVSADDSEAQPAPGMFVKHYSPRARLLLIAGAPDVVLHRMVAVATALQNRGLQVGVLAAAEDAQNFKAIDQVAILGRRDDLAGISHQLFAQIRTLDKSGVDVMVAGQFARTGLGLAIWDRLLRAAEGMIIHASAPPAPVQIGALKITV